MRYPDTGTWWSSPLMSHDAFNIPVSRVLTPSTLIPTTLQSSVRSSNILFCKQHCKVCSLIYGRVPCHHTVDSGGLKSVHVLHAFAWVAVSTVKI